MRYKQKIPSANEPLHVAGLDDNKSIQKVILGLDQVV